MRLPLPPDFPPLITLLALADPVKYGAWVIERVSAVAPEDERDPIELLVLGNGASAVWAYDLALPFLSAAVDGLRAQGRLGLLVQTLVHQSWAAVHLARETVAVAAAEEALRLAHGTGQLRWAMSAKLARATIAGERGDRALADSLTTEAEAVLLPTGAHELLSLVQFARGRVAVAHQDYAAGYDHLARIMDPADVAHNPFVGACALADLIESALQIGKEDRARQHLAELEHLAAITSGPLLQAELGYARPLLASDDDAEELYQTAIGGDLTSWPWYRGRALLWCGRWLRRQRRVAESRAPLRSARELFDALRFPGLADAARQELRASGETSRARAPEAWAQLTPQELQIAQLAAAGLSNREIGQRLYVSHRTVGSHLYRMFPKLGISSRSQLRDALAGAATAA
jgi:ATP/maltotriose-dependent transcriptional regulator MalT